MGAPGVVGPAGILIRCPCNCSSLFSQSIAPVRVRLVCTAANSRTPFLPNAAAHLQVGPGVKGLAENDWVVPLKPNLGTWRSLAGAAGAGMAAAGCRQEQRPWEG